MNLLRRTRATLLLGIAVGALVACSSLQAQTKSYPKRSTPDDVLLNKSMATLRAVLSTVQMLYVDTVPMEKLTNRGVEAMLSLLDPYTEHFTKKEAEEFQTMTTGAYGGIGSFIQEKDSVVYVSSPMPGSPAEKSGLRVGDKFLTIDGVSVVPGTAAQVSGRLKGAVGTQVTVTIERLGESKPRTVTLTRDNVVIDQVPHRGVYGDRVGYISLSSFTEHSADDVRRAYEELKKQKIKSLVLDLRGNTGGVMEGAVKILSMFLPQKTLVLYTAGRLPETSQKYYTTERPIAPEIPLVVLINESSASASEIVAGAIQDLDRGVIIGAKSYGKGLVQSTRQLPQEEMLKLTISRYYIPSGRCIQQIDYSHRAPDGSVAAVPDSLAKVFKTAKGREVRDGGGIRPDIEIKDETLPMIVYAMSRGGYFFEYANKLYLQKGKQTSLPEVTDADFEAFVSYMEQQKFEYGTMSASYLKRLQEVAEYEGYKGVDTALYAQLKEALTPHLRRDIAAHKELVKHMLKGFLSMHYLGSSGQAVVHLQRDASFDRALQLLSSPKEYAEILSPKR